MNPLMVTRNTTAIKFSLSENITEFQLYSGNVRSFVTRNTFDFSEKKLKYLISISLNSLRLNTLSKLLSDYVAGKIALAWKNGEPIYISVIKD